MRMLIFTFLMIFSINGIYAQDKPEEEEGVLTLQEQRHIKRVIKKRDRQTLRKEKREARKQRKLAKKQMKRKQKLAKRVSRDKARKEAVVEQNHQQETTFFEEIKGIFAQKSPYKLDRPHD